MHRTRFRIRIIFFLSFCSCDDGSQYAFDTHKHIRTYRIRIDGISLLWKWMELNGRSNWKFFSHANLPCCCCEGNIIAIKRRLWAHSAFNRRIEAECNLILIPMVVRFVCSAVLGEQRAIAHDRQRDRARARDRKSEGRERNSLAIRWPWPCSMPTVQPKTQTTNTRNGYEREYYICPFLIIIDSIGVCIRNHFSLIDINCFWFPLPMTIFPFRLPIYSSISRCGFSDSIYFVCLESFIDSGRESMFVEAVEHRERN